MARKVEWLSSREAATLLSVKLETLYAYASRGLIESVPAPGGRGRRYARSSVAELKARHDARAGHTVVAASALRWGEPSLETSISDIRADGPAYRGESASALCERAASFESVAELLIRGALGPARWTVSLPNVPPPARPAVPSAGAYFAAAIATAALVDDARFGASDADELVRARRLIAWLASIAGEAPVRTDAGLGVAERLLQSFGARATEARVRVLDRALILCADHELNASTFAARVTASTGADLYACLGSALHTLSGPKHGGVTRQVEALLREIARPLRAAEVVGARLARGEAIPGFGHRLYPDGDPRATALLALAAEVTRPASPQTSLDALVQAMARRRQPAPNLDIGLVAVAQALKLPKGAAAAIFAVGRTAGWIAHALEQRAAGYLLRPRSRYVPSRVDPPSD